MKKPLERAPDRHSERSGHDAAARKPSSLESPVLAARGLTLDAFGNRALLSLLRSGQLQRKARVSQPGDPLERDADRAADAVASGKHAARPVRSAPSPSRKVQRMPTEDQELADALGLGSESGRVTATSSPPPEKPESHAADVVGQLYGGRSLDQNTRESMESRFGENFNDVRIHTGYRAAETADALQSRAFTVGEDIVFAEGQFAPETTEGERLLAHELAHVVQQRQPAGPIAGEKDAERDAREAAREVTSGGTPAVRERAMPGTVQKDGTPVFVYPVYGAFPGTVSMFAVDPQGDQDNVVDLLDETQTVRIGNRSAFEHGGDGGHETLTVRIGIVGSISGTKTYTTARWKHVEAIVNQIPGPQPEPEPKPEPKPTPKTVPVPKPQPKPAPKQPKQAPAPVPPTPEPQPVEPQPEPAPLFVRTEPPAATRLRETLADDPAKAPDAASKLTDRELADLDPADRLGVIEAIAEHGSAGDASTLIRLISTAPDQDAGSLLDSLNADNGKLLRDFKGKLSLDATMQLSFSMMDLSARRTDRLIYSPLDAPQLDLAAMLKGPPSDPTEVHWVGDPMLQPSWTKGLRYWKDAKGNTNSLSRELGLATWDVNGKRLGLPAPGQEDIERAIRGATYLAQTGGKRYVEGKGWLDEAAWKDYLQEQANALGAEEGRKFENLSGGVEEWNKIQSTAAPEPKFFAHLLGGRSTDDPSRIASRTSQDIDIGKNQILRANTPEELNQAKRYLTGVTRYGDYQFSQYKEDVYAGGERTIVGIKVAAAAATAYVSAPVLFTYGGAAITVKGVAIGAGLGGGFSAARQGVEMWEGTRERFSWGEVGQGAVIGGGLVFVPELAPVMMGMGVASGADEFSQGHFKTGAFDIGTSLLPIGVKGAPKFARWARPRVAALTMRLGTGTELGMGGRTFLPSLPVEPQIVLVDVAGRPLTSIAEPATPRLPAAEPVGPASRSQTPGVWKTAPTPNAPSQASDIPIVINLADPIDLAFSPNASFQVGPLQQVGRVRTTGSGRQLMSLDTIPLTAPQRHAAAEVHGQQMAAAQQLAWQRTTNPREAAELAEINRQWQLGTQQSQDRARAVARAAFNRHRDRYWRAVRSDPSLRATFEGAGMRFTGGATTAPIYDLPDGTVVRMTLEHSVRLADNPGRALSSNNLQFVLDDENSVFLEFIRANDPFQR